MPAFPPITLLLGHNYLSIQQEREKQSIKRENHEHCHLSIAGALGVGLHKKAQLVPVSRFDRYKCNCNYV